MAEGQGPQARGRGGRGRGHARRGVAGTAVPHGSLHVCQQQHNGTQLHLRICERCVQEVRCRCLYICPQPMKFSSRPPECVPAHHSECHLGAGWRELHRSLSRHRSRGRPFGFGDLRWATFAPWHEVSQQHTAWRHHQEREKKLRGLLHLCGAAWWRQSGLEPVHPGCITR